ncbi:MAG: lipoprotein [Gammaproteobacteria bacterium]|nr:lipoprotein [Gammaproteobacteria bacterium]MDE1887123.1 lipoprotein [Gammaproteobacteria bacterium]MDE2022929.1 lipoprotein [Gammaproteobacteria bacterium]MDE2139465.1 lipoprotein [Gammaproteobacteria bacterium]MDE2274249.1 lipoprotein [Gammaproteobacteria bacterium]
MRRVLAYLPFLLLAGLGSCGQKGPLYLPVTPPHTIPPMPQATTHVSPAITHAAPTAVTHSAPTVSKPS